MFYFSYHFQKSDISKALIVEKRVYPYRGFITINMALERMHIFISIMPISFQTPMYDNLLESSHRDDSNKWSNIKFSEEIKQVVLINANLYASYLGICLNMCKWLG